MKMKLPKTSHRRLLYLLAVIIISCLGLFLNRAWLKMQEDEYEADHKLLSTHLKQDTETAQYYFYANYRPNTNYIDKFSVMGQNATFINICQKSCILFRGKEVLTACKDLSGKYKFNQYRVYTCSLKVTLENDQPLKCEAINNQRFNNICDKFIASL